MNNNEQHWNTVGADYVDNWKNEAEKKLSEKELEFIFSFFEEKKPERSLDIGVGCGRIIDGYLKRSQKIAHDVKLWGIDISENMVSVCKKRFKDISNVQDIKKCDISLEDVCFAGNFDFISSIRVLKYNQNWENILKKIFSRLNENGVFVFTLLNSRSIDKFSLYPTKVYKTNIPHIKKVLKEIGYELVEIKGFSWIPHIFYLQIAKVKIFAKVVTLLDTILGFIFGHRIFAREIFIVCKKPTLSK